MKKILLILLVLLTFATSHAAQIEPATLSYQGTLTDNTGALLTGTKTIVVSLYDVPTSGTAFWSDTYTVTLKNGQFSVVLGSDAKPLTGLFNRFNGTTYIGIKVGNDLEMPIRQKLTSVAYSINGVPRGGIIMWSGAINQVPAGWALCDGGNGTPDLRDRFIVGAGNLYAVASKGGEAQHTLTSLEMPVHNHSGKTQNNTKSLDHIHDTQAYLIPPGMPHQNFSGGSTSFQWSSGTGGVQGGAVALEHDHPVVSDGNGQPHENRPPFYALAYIMKL